MTPAGKWIGVDLDGTLARDDVPLATPTGIGPPVPLMVGRVKQWLAAGIDVRIVTARVSGPYTEGFNEQDQRLQIVNWCLEHIGRALPITCSKDYLMHELWDDRAVRVKRNTGRHNCCSVCEDLP